MSEHTPGPWKSSDRFPGVVLDGGNPPRQVASASGNDADERIANARLIAAAPDLLHALQVVAAQIDDIDDLCNAEACKAVRAAIAKATGAE
jgi:hypothetical protein